MRSQDVKNSYVETGVWNEESKSLLIGSQMAYEWEQDFIAMKQAVDYILNGGFQGKIFAFDILMKRISEYSCPSALKEHLRTKENCPLKDKCKCSQLVSNK